jgi:hypothetical protein
LTGAEEWVVWRWWSGGWLRGFVFAGGGPVWAAFVPGVRLLAGLSEAAVIVVVMGFRDCLTGLKAGLLADRRAVAGGRIGGWARAARVSGVGMWWVAAFRRG